MDVLKSYVSPSRQGRPAAPKGKAAGLRQQQIEQYGFKRLVTVFAAWKLLLLAIACASPGIGYDTSTQVFLDQHRDSGETSWFAKAIEHLVLRLTRWDGIYFASASLHGKVYEQEWAFSWALSKATFWFASGACTVPTHERIWAKYMSVFQSSSTAFHFRISSNTPLLGY